MHPLWVTSSIKLALGRSIHLDLTFCGTIFPFSSEYGSCDWIEPSYDERVNQ